MNLVENLRTALTALTSNKMRSILTMLGIIIGVAAVIALSSLGQGVQDMVSDSIQGLGSNMLFVMPNQPEDATAPAYLTTYDADAISDPFNAPSVSSVSPVVSGQRRVTSTTEATTLTVVGTNADYAAIRSMEYAIGSFLNDEDMQDRARVAVLGWNAYEELFAEGEYPLEQTISIDGIRFRVVGVLQESGGMPGLSTDDDSVFIPISTAHDRFFATSTLSGRDVVNTIYVSVVDESQASQAEAQVAALLREIHRLPDDAEADFRIINQQQILDTSSQITGVLTAFLSAIAGISLLVGGIGIMNIMLVTVTERTREIGIRKAVGATSTVIALQFLIESIVLTLLGGLVGILLGSAASSVLSKLMSLSTEITSNTVLLSTGVSTLVGVVFGVYPALRAARLNPIQALRHE